MRKVYLQTQNGEIEGPIPIKKAHALLQKRKDDFQDLICFEGTEVWLPSDVIFHKSGRSTLMICFVALVFSLIALALAFLGWSQITSYREDVGSGEPRDVVREIYERTTEGLSLDASQAYRIKNRKEILDTLEIAEVAQNDGFAVAFVRYSIGADIFRKAHWLASVDQKWYWVSYISESSDQKPADEEWFSTMLEKAETWEDEGSEREF